MRIVTQGIPGSFHYEACYKYFNSSDFDLISAKSFDELSNLLLSDDSISYGVMAIENSIAGSIIKNYRIIREGRLRIVGEKYLPIVHNLLVLPGQNLTDITEVHSHPMALNQCLPFLNKHGINKRISTSDTASSAQQIKELGLKRCAAIASDSCAKLYGLENIASAIQTSKINYTRFFVLQRDTLKIPEGDFNKSSIYLKTAHQKGSLLKVLEKIYEHNINLSKLQSYPVIDAINKYYFHLDLEFDDQKQYEKAILELESVTQHLEVLGVYKNGLDALTFE